MWRAAISENAMDPATLLPLIRDVGFPVFVAVFCLLKVDSGLRRIDISLASILEELRRLR
jgi:hypothetical protein